VGVLKKKTPPKKKAAFSFSVPGTGNNVNAELFALGKRPLR
jgi:hypothetical protein